MTRLKADTSYSVGCSVAKAPAVRSQPPDPTVEQARLTRSVRCHPGDDGDEGGGDGDERSCFFP